MKKILSVSLTAVMLVGLLAFAGCGKEKLSMGLGVYTPALTATDASDEANGEGEADACGVAVLVDKNGKVVKMAMDVAQNKAQYTATGEFVAAEYPSKRQKGDGYNMAKFGADRNGDGKVLEWYAQADAFIEQCIGKTATEIKAFAADDHYGIEEIQKAGCTIHVSDFVLATVKAIENAKASEATADCSLGLGVASEQSHSSKNATEEGDGLNEVDSSFAAVAYDKNGKVVNVITDVVQQKFGFDTTGKATTDTTSLLKTKLELGDGYNMAKFGTDRNGDGAVLEWYDQSAAFNTFCVGHTVAEVAGFAQADGYGIADLQTAKCTMSVSELVKAVQNAMK
ncbi:MAG: hypothetical protein MJ124_07420 [Lachnospiraceae bacterium]|nr:hypothetical protein [Lachnospiraceae bacterium]